MTVQTSNQIRPHRSLRARMIGGLALVGVFIVLAILLFFWQLSTLRNTFRESQVQEERLALALRTAEDVTSLMIVAQNAAEDRRPGQFLQKVSVEVADLRRTRDQMAADVSDLPVSNPVRVRAEELIASLDNVISVGEGSIVDAESGDWELVEVDASVLAKGYSKVNWHLDRLIAQVSVDRTKTEVQARETMQRMISISFPLLVAAMVVAAGVVFAAVRSVTTGVEQLNRSARRLAEGHFDERITMVREDELGQVARSFNTMADELQEFYAGLEQQVKERTADLLRRSTELEAAAQVARNAATIHHVDELLEQTVHLISERFSFYHAGIYLLDEWGEYAVLQAASSEGGQRMLGRGHKLRAGETGIVGYTADVGESRIAFDVGTDAVFFDNPDLPDTRSEMALPLKVRERVIGVLDVQSTEQAAFAEGDLAILQTMADQVAVAIDNARLLEESERALEELQALYGRQAREAWQKRVTSRPAAYRYTGAGVESALASTPEMEDLPSTAEPILVQEDDGRKLVSPIRLRGQSIGSLVLRQSPEEEPWSSEEIALLNELSVQIGLALENARLLEETQQRAAREQLTSEITNQMRETLDVERVLKAAVSEIRQSLGLDRVVVRLRPEGENPPREDG